MESDKAQNIRQVQLPSGKMIEVVYFDQKAVETPETQPPGAAQPTTDDLHVCPRCESELVYPTDWTEVGSTHWEVTRRCPECEWSDADVFAQPAVERFDVELDRGAEALLRDLQHLAHANMADEIDRFVQALRADAIVPSDF